MYVIEATSAKHTIHAHPYEYATIFTINKHRKDGDLIYESALGILALITLSSNDGLDESAHMRRLANPSLLG